MIMVNGVNKIDLDDKISFIQIFMKLYILINKKIILSQVKRFETKLQRLKV